jgi:uncharacterized membrane protein YfcA
VHPAVDLAILAGVTLVSFALSWFGASIGLVLGQMRLALLVWWLGSPAIGATTSLAISSLGSVVGAIGHVRAGHVDIRLFAAVGLPSAFAAAVGTRSLRRLDPGAVQLAIGSAVLLAGIGMMIAARRAARTGAPNGKQLATTAPQPEPRTEHDSSPTTTAPPAPAGPTPDTASSPAATASRARPVAEVLTGLTIGVAVGVTGLLLGTLRLPILLRLHPGAAMAVGTNMAIGAFTGVVAALTGGLVGQVDLRAFAVIGGATALGAWLGARSTAQVDPERLRLWIALTLVAIGASMLTTGALALRG